MRKRGLGTPMPLILVSSIFEDWADPVMSVLHFPHQNPPKQKSTWCSSTLKTSPYPLTHSTTPYTFPHFVPATHSPPSHIKGDLNWRRKLAWNLKMSKKSARTDLQAMVGCSTKGSYKSSTFLLQIQVFWRSSHAGSVFTREEQEEVALWCTGNFSHTHSLPLFTTSLTRTDRHKMAAPTIMLS